MTSRFTDSDIKLGLRQIADAAIEQCAVPFNALLKEKRQGLEKIFQNAFMENTNHPGWSGSSWVNRATFDNKDKHRPKGWVDAVIKHDEGHRIGIEFKVCEFPRLKNTSPWVTLYDVGQLAWDYGALKIYDMESAYCIVVLHGGFVSMKGATALGIARQFHNAMYVDFQASKHWGEFKYKKLSAEQKRQKETIEAIGYDRPYNRSHQNMHNFHRLYPQHGLAVVGISIK